MSENTEKRTGTKKAAEAAGEKQRKALLDRSSPMRKSILAFRSSKILKTKQEAEKKKAAAAAAEAEAAAVLKPEDLIGSFPSRNEGKKVEPKKAATGPVFKVGQYRLSCRNTELSKAVRQEFTKVFLKKYRKDTLDTSELGINTDTNNAYFSECPYEEHRRGLTEASFQSLLNGETDIVIHNMKEIPLDLPEGVIIAGALKREDPRDAMITRATYGAVQELPRNSRIGARSQRRIMQIKNLRPDLEIIPTPGPLASRIQELDSGRLDALVVSWAGLKRLNISPRYYVALQPEVMLPSACQGIIGILCLESNAELLQKINYIEDTESSWAARCERAFLTKFGEFGDAPVGANAHRKGTQDPWILDCVIGEGEDGEVLRHREIGTSRCKPESLADKAYTGIIAKGARKYFPFKALSFSVD